MIKRYLEIITHEDDLTGAWPDNISIPVRTLTHKVKYKKLHGRELRKAKIIKANNNKWAYDMFLWYHENAALHNNLTCRICQGYREPWPEKFTRQVRIPLYGPNRASLRLRGNNG